MDRSSTTGQISLNRDDGQVVLAQMKGLSYRS